MKNYDTTGDGHINGRDEIEDGKFATIME